MFGYDDDYAGIAATSLHSLTNQVRSLNEEVTSLKLNAVHQGEIISRIVEDKLKALFDDPDFIDQLQWKLVLKEKKD